MVRHDFHRVDRRSTIFEQRRSALFPEAAKSVFSATRHIWNGNSFSKAEFIELTSARGHPHQTSSCDSGCGIFTHSSPDSSALVRKRQMHCKERKNALENMGSELKIPWSCLSIVCSVLLVQLLYICVRKKCSKRFHLLWALFRNDFTMINVLLTQCHGLRQVLSTILCLPFFPSVFST